MNPIVIGRYIDPTEVEVNCPFCGEIHRHEIPLEELNDSEIGYRMSKCKNFYIQQSYYIIITNLDGTK